MVKVKMVSLAQKVKDPYGPAKMKEKTKTEHPTVTLNSKQIKGLTGLSLDNEVTLTFKATVKGLREPDNWDKERLGLTEDDAIAEFKLIEGSVQPQGRTYEGMQKEALKK